MNSRPVLVAGLSDAILVVVCLDPPDAYASKDQKHIGHIREGHLVFESEMTLTPDQAQAIERAYEVLRATMTILHSK